MYNTSNLTSATNLLEVMVATNQLANNTLFLFLTIGLWIILFMAFNFGARPVNAIAAASFITGIAGILFVLSGLIAQDFLIYYILTMGLATAAAFISNKGD